ncbi:MAG: hypothetical protein KDD62_10035, partial [Bdellovibrionales bacterium]|nr:hypothetical protein [Bdellovibrionales bacterium]
MDTLRLGSRASALALAQSEMCIAQLQKLHPSLQCPIVHIKNSGDKVQGTPQAGLLDKKAWIDGLEQALLEGEIDCAIHSGKDLPADPAEGTTIIS